jgi:hypothetical protein
MIRFWLAFSEIYQIEEDKYRYFPTEDRGRP